jgi:hypothetical protein
MIGNDGCLTHPHRASMATRLKAGNNFFTLAKKLKFGWFIAILPKILFAKKPNRTDIQRG